MYFTDQLLGPANLTLPLAGWRIEPCMSRPFGTAAELGRRRRRAVELVAQGESRADVARILGAHPKTLARWLRLARQPCGLDPKPHPGRPPALSGEQLRQLEPLPSQGATADGWRNPPWTPARAA